VLATHLGPDPPYSSTPLKRAMSVCPPIFSEGGTMVIPSCYYSTNYVALNRHDEQLTLVYPE
jgi:hypothetical protein